LELVKAQYITTLSNISSHKRHSINIIAIFHLQLMQPAVDILHEVVEVYARLGADRRRERIVEEIHEHGLSAANVAVEVQPAGQVGGNIADGWLEEVDARADDGWRVVVSEFVVEVLEVLDYAWRCGRQSPREALAGGWMGV
jgi:hypothetical protein